MTCRPRTSVQRIKSGLLAAALRTSGPIVISEADLLEVLKDNWHVDVKHRPDGSYSVKAVKKKLYAY